MTTVREDGQVRCQAWQQRRREDGKYGFSSEKILNIREDTKKYCRNPGRIENICIYSPGNMESMATVQIRW